MASGPASPTGSLTPPLTCVPVPPHPPCSGSPGCAAHAEHGLAQDLLLANCPPEPGSGKVSVGWGHCGTLGRALLEKFL